MGDERRPIEHYFHKQMRIAAESVAARPNWLQPDWMREKNQQRQLTLDPALKGKKNGNCNRTACQKPGATYYNAVMQAWYCPVCARAINEGQPKDRPLCVLPKE